MYNRKKDWRISMFELRRLTKTVKQYIYFFQYNQEEFRENIDLYINDLENLIEYTDSYISTTQDELNTLYKANINLYTIESVFLFKPFVFIIMKLLEDRLDLESITVMIQKEVADRLIAIPGEKETGAITYSVYYYATAEGIMEVPNDSFIPEPEVTSKVIKLTLRKEPPVEVKSRGVMFRIIKSAFMQRRKTLLNALTNTKVFMSKEEGLRILKELHLDENVRAEKLTLEDFAEITNKILVDE